MFRFLLAGLAALVVASGAAVAQVSSDRCAPLSEWVNFVTGPKYNEVPAFTATSEGPNGDQLPVLGFANKDTGTFTVIVAMSPTVACQVIGGKDFEPIALESTKPGKGA